MAEPEVRVPALLTAWHRRVLANSQRAIRTYAKELPEYRELLRDPPARRELLDFTVALRRRTVELAADAAPFTAEDHELVRLAGAQRASRGVAPASQRRALGLHTNLLLSELREVADLDASADVLRLLAWMAAQGAELSRAFTDGYLAGQARSLSLGARLRLAASMALANEPATAQFWRHLNLPPSRSFLVTAMRLAGAPPPDDGARDEIVGVLYLRHRVCVAWTDPADLTALVPCSGTDNPAPAERELALTLARDVTDLTGQRCSVGATVGTVPRLADATALARQICGQAPAERVPRQVHGLADVFAELAVDRDPAVSDWLRSIADKLLLGPDLVSTLHTYYRCDMNRLRASAALQIHPRTLDYRLRRTHTLTGVDPHSTTGIRILSVVTTRVLAGAWPGAAAAGR